MSRLLTYIETLILGKEERIDVNNIEKSRHFCIMPWVHFHVTQKGFVTPCCQVSESDGDVFGSINEKSLLEIWNDSGIKKFRRKMIRDQADHRCQMCYNKEKNGFKSLRNVTNKDYKHHLHRLAHTKRNGYLLSHKPVYFDIRFSNLCNFKCRICGPKASSKWFDDALKLGIINKDQKAIDYSISNKELFWEQIEDLIPEMEEIYFAGGEPLIMEEHYEFLELLRKHKQFDVHLKYNTNFSSLKFKQWDAIKMWRNFKKITLSASLDGSEIRGEYQRKNQKWNEVVENRRKILKENSNIRFLITPTLNVFNVLHLTKFHKDWFEKGLIGAFELIPSLLQNPKYYDIAILPLNLKEQAISEIESHINWLQDKNFKDEELKKFALDQWRGAINRLNIQTDKTQLKKFRNITKKLDSLRGESFVESFPELSILLSSE